MANESAYECSCEYEYVISGAYENEYENEYECEPRLRRRMSAASVSAQ